jgi:hypothetical protein
MIYKTLSVNQPYATLICAGVKDVENRDWKTNYRGKLLIHASGKDHFWPSEQFFPDGFLDKVETFYDSR